MKISNEKDYRQRWTDPSDKILQNYKKKEWPLKMLKQFKQLEDTTRGGGVRSTAKRAEVKRSSTESRSLSKHKLLYYT